MDFKEPVLDYIPSLPFEAGPSGIGIIGNSDGWCLKMIIASEGRLLLSQPRPQ